MRAGDASEGDLLKGEVVGNIRKRMLWYSWAQAWLSSYQALNFNSHGQECDSEKPFGAFHRFGSVEARRWFSRSKALLRSKQGGGFSDIQFQKVNSKEQSGILQEG